ncbi:MAG: CRTAC1 family protein [Saprospiraceae bacterium]|nr:CRTAC1 family protein [Saprospiraceae bacterium]
MFRIVLTLAVLAMLGACQNNQKNTSADQSGQTPLFTLLPGSETGVTFRNDLHYDRDFNIYKYRNFYNGGGVAIGDVNRDGLPDLFFTSNMDKNRLYLNRGNFKFEDVSEAAGIEGKGSWATGVAMADVNGDGWLDIYVCNSGNPRSDEKNNGFNRENELFINDGNGLHFTEKAREYGLADRGLTTHTAFFDYDRDGDLDAYVLNNSFRAIGSFDLRKNLRYTRDSLGGHKLLKNNTLGAVKPLQPGAPAFEDISQSAGILGSVIAFGLGVTVGDADMDGWQDIYVSNDFFERDYLYINDHKGGFKEELENSMRHISAASMGADMADINNDAFPDIFVTDMLPEPDYRIKTTTSFDSPDRFKYTTGSGYYNQFSRNMLHLNNGMAKPGSQGGTTFSDIACLASAEATDWSWGALMLDMDNDGWRDIFVANGIAQDLTNQDYLMFAADPVIQQEIVAGGAVDFKRLIDSIPSEPQPNYAFHNQHNLTFKNRAADWGLAKPGFSNGSAYGDLDNDGDLDLVVNNANMEAFVYRNESDKVLKNNYIKFELTGADLNTQALGAKIFIRAGGQTFYQEQMPMRGFQSSMDPRPLIGLGNITSIDTVLVVWPTGDKVTLMNKVPVNQTLKLAQADANVNAFPLPWLQTPASYPFEKMAASATPKWEHRESSFFDWDRDRLLYFLYSTEGPRMATGDVNGDGRQDYFVCGAAGQSGAVFIQTPNGIFAPTAQPDLAADAAAEDVDAAFFDADGDKDLDLYVASGSNEFQPTDPQLADRLYLNDGKGRFSRKKDALPDSKPFASGCVKPADADGDGDLDVFVGMRLVPGQVGVPVGGFLMMNDGKGYFAPSPQASLKNLGLVTDAQWDDVDSDGDPDLLVVGEWMPLTLLRNDAGKLTNATTEAGLATTSGLWKRLQPGDFNGDGHTDYFVGNQGLNSRLDASSEQPLSLFFNDFDQNGLTEQILCRYNTGLLLPYVLRGDLVGNMPILKKKYLAYRNYQNKQMTDIFKPEQLKDAIELRAGQLANGVLMSDGKGKFTFTPLPSEAQFAPLYGFAVGDFDGDGFQDAVAGGNFKGAKPEFGFQDADYGLFLKGDGKGGFQALRSRQSGLLIEGDVRDVQMLKLAGRPVLAVARNNAAF